MRQEKIHDALNFLDDDMVEAVEWLRSNRKNRRIYWMKSLALVACICVTLMGILVFASRGGIYFGDFVVSSDSAPENTNTSGRENIQESESLDGNESFVNGNDEIKGESQNGGSGESDGESNICVPEEVPSVLIEIEAWMENGFEGKVAGIIDTEIFAVGTEIFVSFEKGVYVGRWSEDGEVYSEVEEVPESREFSVGSVVSVRFEHYDMENGDGKVELSGVAIAFAE